MQDPNPAIPLSGGNTNAEVVRIGDRVHRALPKHAANISRLLRHLEAQRFDAAPRDLGLDDAGRQVLSFIEGSTEFPADLWQHDRALLAAARLLRLYHDATLALMDKAGTDWAFVHPDPAQREVICHNDFAPYNMVFRENVPIAIIDFDLAGPGPRLRDLAYLAYWMVPLCFTKGEMARATAQAERNGFARLRALADAYGSVNMSELLHMVEIQLAHMADEAAMLAMLGPSTTKKLKQEGHLDHWQAERLAYQKALPHLLSLGS